MRPRSPYQNRAKTKILEQTIRISLYICISIFMYSFVSAFFSVCLSACFSMFFYLKSVSLSVFLLASLPIFFKSFLSLWLLFSVLFCVYVFISDLFLFVSLLLLNQVCGPQSGRQGCSQSLVSLNKIANYRPISKFMLSMEVS